MIYIYSLFRLALTQWQKWYIWRISYIKACSNLVRAESTLLWLSVNIAHMITWKEHGNGTHPFHACSGKVFSSLVGKENIQHIGGSLRDGNTQWHKHVYIQTNVLRPAWVIICKCQRLEDTYISRQMKRSSHFAKTKFIHKFRRLLLVSHCQILKLLKFKLCTYIETNLREKLGKLYKNISG